MSDINIMDYVKKLTGKNPTDFESAAAHIVNNSDVKVFEALVGQSDFIFPFIKQNVLKRLLQAVNNSNYKNLMSFLTVYSHDYEEFVISPLVQHADEEMTDEMLDLLENGKDAQKTYAAKYFAHINDTLAIELLRKYSYSDFDYLALNCAHALSAMKDEESYNLAVKKLESDDEFELLSAVRFLTAYNDSKAVEALFKAMKKSSMPENIASEIPYLKSFLGLLDSEYKNDAILAINNIINGLGEIISLSQVFDFQLYELLDKIIKSDKCSKAAVVLLHAQLKFEQLTENDEYLFDEDKNTKEEVYEIKKYLNSQPSEFWTAQKELVKDELTDSSDFIFAALELVQELNLVEMLDKLKNLLTSQNQTIILKTVEVIKSLGKLSEIDKNTVLEKVSDENIKAIIESNFS